MRLLNEGEELGDLLRLPPEQILLRWINFHMKGTGGERVVNNFGADLQDGEAYIRILSQIDPVRCPLSLLEQPADARCHSVVAAAKSMGIPGAHPLASSPALCFFVHHPLPPFCFVVL